MRGFQGNFGVFVRSYAYICSLGAEGLREVSELAVLNANYLKARLAEDGIGEYLPIAFDRHCMHEFVLSRQGRQGEARHQDAGHRQAAARPRGAPAHRVLPAAGGRGADDRAHRDRAEGAPRPLRRRDPPTCARPRRTRRSPERAAHHAGAPPRRGRRGEAARRAPAALAEAEAEPPSRGPAPGGAVTHGGFPCRRRPPWFLGRGPEGRLREGGTSGSSSGRRGRFSRGDEGLAGMRRFW